MDGSGGSAECRSVVIRHGHRRLRDLGSLVHRKHSDGPADVDVRWWLVIACPAPSGWPATLVMVASGKEAGNGLLFPQC